MKNTIAIMVILFSFVCVFAFPGDLPNLYQPRYQVFTAGQPTNVGYGQLAVMGVKTVINVLPENECIAGEPSMVIANNMVYYSLPFDPSNLNKETLEQFALLLANEEKPVLIHCSTGNHVGGLWFAYRVLIEKAHLSQALKEGRLIGMQPAMEDIVFNWVTTAATS